MKKGFLLFLSFLFILPITYADIIITTDQNIYNLGNKIKASASILQANNFEGLFKLTISCGNYKLEYFLTPISLEANYRTAVSVPPITTTSLMLGNCSIIGDLLTNDNLVIEQKESKSFSITDHLTVLPIHSKITALPGETIQVIGIINEAFGNNVLKATTKIILDNNSYDIDAVDGKFNFTINLEKTIKSRKHRIQISASDSKNNIGSSSIELDVTPVPKYIKTELSNYQIAPGTKIEITVSLYDQADDLITTSLNLELISPNGDKIYRKVVQSNDKIEYEFSQYAEPGIYVLVSTFKNLLSKVEINITKVKEVKVRYDNESVFIENIGNVPFEDELTFMLESNLKKYPITKKIKVEPGKILSFDLSKEVPLGIYDVILPLKEGLLESISSLNLFPEKSSVLAEDVTIHDNRPFYKRVLSSFGSFSGLIVGSDGLLAKNPIIAPMILVIIILLIIFRYGRKPIMRLIKGKKEDKEEKKKED